MGMDPKGIEMFEKRKSDGGEQNDGSCLLFVDSVICPFTRILALRIMRSWSLQRLLGYLLGS